MIFGGQWGCLCRSEFGWLAFAWRMCFARGLVCVSALAVSVVDVFSGRVRYVEFTDGGAKDETLSLDISFD